MRTGPGSNFLFPRDGFGSTGAHVSLPGWVSAGRPALDAVCVQLGDSPAWLTQAKLQRVLLGKDAWEQP